MTKPSNFGRALIAGLVLLSATAGAATPEGRDVPVIVELFTSESCSSCPPADQVLTHLVNTQPIKGVQVIALAEHVTYWNHLNWKDRYAQEQFTARQRHYGTALPSSVYTPQMVIDGHDELIGSFLDQAKRAIARAAKAPKARLQLTTEDDSVRSDAINLKVHISELRNALGRHRADLWVAITEDRLSTGVKGGENRGRTLHHTGLVRSLHKVGTVRAGLHGEITLDGRVPLAADWSREQLKVVAFVQRRGLKQIVGAAAVPLATLGASREVVPAVAQRD